MRPKIIIAIILIALGIMAFAYQGITYTTREKVVDLGPIQMTAEKTKMLPLPPRLGPLLNRPDQYMASLRSKRPPAACPSLSRAANCSLAAWA
jgi:hypothetical protein